MLHWLKISPTEATGEIVSLVKNMVWVSKVSVLLIFAMPSVILSNNCILPYSRYILREKIFVKTSTLVLYEYFAGFLFLPNGNGCHIHSNT